jgi:hypothetical protein
MRRRRPQASGQEEAKELIALNPRKKIPFKLAERVVLSRNSRLFRFALQSPKHRLGLPVGQHMFFSAKARRVAPRAQHRMLCCSVVRALSSNLQRSVMCTARGTAWRKMFWASLLCRGLGGAFAKPLQAC